ncbi:hypothetical protein CPB86DRAFT_789852 [Serendipita vermifera]|nr:hypothetical protein CPB86DRAFT_789852 [Serendipita vermifera]
MRRSRVCSTTPIAKSLSPLLIHCFPLSRALHLSTRAARSRLRFFGPFRQTVRVAPPPARKYRQVVFITSWEFRLAKTGKSNDYGVDVRNSVRVP